MQLEESLRENLANNLIRLREERKLTQEGLVEALLQEHGLELSRTSLAAYETKRSFPKVDALYVLAQYFKISIEELLQQETSAKKSTILASGEIDQLMHDYGDALEYMHFYRSLFYSAVKTADNIADETQKLTIKAHLMDVFLLEKSKREEFKMLIKEVLSETEFRVFDLVQKGMKLQELVTLLQLKEDAIARLFISAKDTILKTINNQP